MKIISTTKAPTAIGPYSQAVAAGQFLYVSGQIPFNPTTMQCVAGGIKPQVRQSLTNLQAVVEAAGKTLNDVVKVNIYLQNMDDFPVMNKIYATFFRTHHPARAAVEVARLPRDVAIEIEAIVYLG